MKAFPKNNNPLTHPYQDGMDLRDYFAIKYVNGIISNPDFNIMTSFEELAKTGYNLADAMMKAREK